MPLITSGPLLRQLMAQQSTIASDLADIRENIGKAIQGLALVNQRNESADKIHADHESRIRACEAFRNKMIGIALLLGSIGGTIAGVVFHAVH